MGTGITESIEESLILTVLDLANHLTRSGERIAREEGLTAQQWLLLLQIAGDPNFPMPGQLTEGGSAVLASNFATARGVSRPSISALVSSLIQKGLVSQAEEPGDRRQKALCATPAGLEALARIEPERRRANQSLLDGFEPSDLSNALKILRTCLDALWAAGRSETERRQPAASAGEEAAPEQRNPKKEK